MQTLLNLLAGVSLLVWGTHIVRTGILRVYGGDLRRFLRRSVSRRGIAFSAKPVVQAAGVKVIFASLTGDVLLDMLVSALLTVLCFSSLAVVLLLATLASLHVIALPVALGLVLGANLGSGLLGILSTM